MVVLLALEFGLSIGSKVFGRWAFDVALHSLHIVLACLGYHSRVLPNNMK